MELNDYIIVVVVTTLLLVSIIRYRSIDKVYIPFIYYIWLTALIEFLSLIVLKMVVKNNLFLTNTFVLLEGFLWIWLFSNWRLFERKPISKYLILGSFVVVWTVELIDVGGIFEFLRYYRIYYSFVLALIAIHSLNFQIVHEKGNLLKSARFLITLSLLMYFTYKGFFEAFYVRGSKLVFDLLFAVNLLSKALFIIALLWIPNKSKI
jgi:hypothetical protein